MEIRRETSADYAAVHEVHAKAFEGEIEARLVEALRANGKAVVSLVAVHLGRVVGHILFSPVTVGESNAGSRVLGLAPMSVLPEYQHKGFGSELVRKGLEECRRQSYEAVVVLGHTHYYPRFGFRRAKECGLENEYNATDAFMVLELKPGILETLRGLVKYATEFHHAGF